MGTYEEEKKEKRINEMTPSEQNRYFTEIERKTCSRRYRLFSHEDKS